MTLETWLLIAVIFLQVVTVAALVRVIFLYRRLRTGLVQLGIDIIAKMAEKRVDQAASVVKDIRQSLDLPTSTPIFDAVLGRLRGGSQP